VFVIPGERRAFRARLVGVAREPRDQIWDFWLQPRDREPFYAALSVAPVRTPNGDLQGLRWLLRDITWRKQTQDHLQEERNFIATVLETIDALVVVLDPQGLPRCPLRCTTPPQTPSRGVM
jgi:PAS domain-containing protein